MKVALAVWNERISPVFDVSRRILVLDIKNGVVLNNRMEAFVTDAPSHKAGRLVELEVETLICGAVSQTLAGILANKGIRMVSFIAGNVDDVIKAFIGGKLPNRELTMPGCCCRKGFQRGRNCSENSRGGKRR